MASHLYKIQNKFPRSDGKQLFFFFFFRKDKPKNSHYLKLFVSDKYGGERLILQ